MNAVEHSTPGDPAREPITLGLHDVSPQHLVDAMASDVVLELGWGRLIFGQTFADPVVLADTLAHERPGRRDICIYARESHVLISRAPNELFIDPSHTYRLRFSRPRRSPGPTTGSPSGRCRHSKRPTRSTACSCGAAWCRPPPR